MDGYILQDIMAMVFQPGYEVLQDTFLAPSPSFTAAPALEAVLVWYDYPISWW
jgi:hypothetical protein